MTTDRPKHYTGEKLDELVAFVVAATPHRPGYSEAMAACVRVILAGPSSTKGA